MKKTKTLRVSGQEIANGFSIKLLGKEYKTIYPKDIWGKTPKDIRKALVENLVYGNTHFLPIILDYDRIIFSTNFPLFESFLFKSMLYDLTYCETADQVKSTSYIKKFYNAEFEFNLLDSTLPNSKIVNQSSISQAILPFSFGKESLLVLALCYELKIKPIVIYSQEPSQPFEENYKKKSLVALKKNLNVSTHFVRNDAGMFRNTMAFRNISKSEVGWGTQTMLLSLLAIPFAYAYNASYLFFGNEISNNVEGLSDGWRVFPSFDQTTRWVIQHRNMIRTMTNDSCSVYSLLEPLEQIHIFFILHHRYPDLGKFQFSCGAEKPLLKNSQWCHKCYKCCRMYMYALCCDIDPEDIGFKKNLFKDEKLYIGYFDEDIVWGFPLQLGFNYHVLLRKALLPNYAKKHLQKRLPNMKSWSWYKKNFNVLKTNRNLPPAYRSKLKKIFKEELDAFNKSLPQ